MTTPTTPAGWYPDPDGSGGQRYWDGYLWTEHRSPAVSAPEPAGEIPTSEQPTSVVSLPDQPTTVVPTGAHRASQEPEPEIPTSAPEPPSFGPPSYEPPTFETPSFEATAAEATASSTAPSSEAPSSETPTYESPSSEAPPSDTPSYEPPSHEPPKFETPSYEAPSYEAPTYEASTYEAPSYETPSYDAPSFGAPAAFAGSDGTGGPPNDNRKLITAYLGGVGVLLLALILAAVYGFVIRDNTPPQVSSSGTSTSATSSESSTTETSSASESTTPEVGGEATDGEFVFSVASTDSGDTITSPIDDSVVKTASGEYFVVYVNVGNNGATPLTWLSVLQLLSDGSQTFAPDVEASAALTGDDITIDPGEQLEVALAFDVPVGTVPASITLHGDPGSAGVELPV